MTDLSGWSQLGKAQQKAAKAAANRIEDADLKFVMMLFGDGGRGAVISNIEPAQAADLIARALVAAQARVETEEIYNGGPMQ